MIETTLHHLPSYRSFQYNQLWWKPDPTGPTNPIDTGLYVLGEPTLPPFYSLSSLSTKLIEQEDITLLVVDPTTLPAVWQPMA